MTIHLKALKANFHFNEKELLLLVEKYPYLRHLREAVAMKFNNVRVYVASPYDTLLSVGFSLDEVREIATNGVLRASQVFGGRFEIYSPVLDFGLENISRQEAMKRCFDELKRSNFLFISDNVSTLKSKGIYEEFKFAKQNKIAVIFDNPNIEAMFKKRLRDENKATKENFFRSQNV
ncbi:MAG: hypothetical protein ACTTJC_01995 [Campylobacter sp.]